MLASENELQQNDGILIEDMSMGLGYQCGGAFQRLARRLVALGKGKASQLSKLAVQVHDLSADEILADADRADILRGALSTLILCPNEALANGRALSTTECRNFLALREILRERNPKLHTILVAPLASRDEELKAFNDDQGTVLLCPPLYSFRDHGLFDWGLSQVKKNPAQLLSNSIPERSIGVAAASDVAALLISVPQNPKFFKQVVRVPTQESSLRAFYRELARAFDVQPTLSHKLSSWLAKPHGPDTWERPELAPTASQATHPLLQAKNANEMFPTPMSALPRDFKKAALSHSRDPESELFFLPSRAP